MAITPGLSNANAAASPLQPWWDMNVADQAGDPRVIIEDRFAGIKSMFTFTYPHDLPKYYFQLIVSNYQRDFFDPTGGALTSRVQINPEGIIRLPLPIGLIDNHIVDYEEQPLNQVLSGLASLTDVNVIKNLGYTPNNILTIFLKGPKYKRIQFAWRISPKTPAESKTMKDIIRKLNNAMSPSIVSKALGLVSWFKMPKIFYPEIHPNSQYMYKFKPCVLENLVVNYTPGGQPAFYRESNQTPLNPGGRGNAPEGFEISMQFLELEYWLTGDFKDNNDPRDVTGPRTNDTRSDSGDSNFPPGGGVGGNPNDDPNPRSP
jgi:hypothetical protein